MKVLMLVPEQAMAGFVQNGLHSEGHHCERAHDERDALLKAQSHAFDALLVQDLQTKLSTQRLCEAVRQKSLDLFVLVIGDGLDALRASSLIKAGADDYLKRPLSFAELVARMDALMRRSHTYTQAHHRTVVGDLVIDRELYEVRHEGRPITLTAKEFALLELLARSPGRPLSRSRILEQVWGFDADPLTNVVDVHISNLRRKLGGTEASNPIQTVRGVGYRLQLPN